VIKHKKQMASSSNDVVVDKYKMDHEKRGTALVINIRSFEGDKLKNREIKSRIDVDNLKRTLEYLEFDFKLCDNFKAEEIGQEVQRQALIDHSQSDCFFCVVMSHGNDKDMFYSSDNKEISLEQIMYPDENIQINLQDKDSKTALLWASGYGHKEIVQMLEALKGETNISSTKQQENIENASLLKSTIMTLLFFIFSLCLL
jgi:ankyrin repeat protein